MKKRKKNSHKGENGRVLVIGGSKRYSGAPFLAAQSVACLRTGSDLVYVACPEKVARSINSLSPDLITIKLSGENLGTKHLKKIMKKSENVDVVLIGNGVGEKKDTLELTKKLSERIEKPKVIDGDALRNIDLMKINNSVLTPHAEEFKELLKKSKLNEKNIRKALRDNVILLKGPKDRIISLNEEKEIKTGNPGMSVGGTGDVLAGIVAGLVSLGEKKFNASLRAAKINGKIGNKLEKEFGYGFIASDFLKDISKEVWKK